MINLSGKKVAVLGGATGLLGRALVRALEAKQADATATTRADLNVTNENEVATWLDQTQPEILFNCVAYTAVDKAEDDVEAATLLNSEVPAILGRQCSSHNILLIHYSTDFVFDGRSEHPYFEEDRPAPASVYGQTKLDGETALLDLGYDKLLIIRTAWLFGPGKTNFVHKILGLAKERETISVVNDQIGSPTFAPDLAKHTLDLIRHNARGLFHLTNSGKASWCELATEAVSVAGLNCRVDPVPTSAYPTRAVRPAYSALSTAAFTKATSITPRPWPQALRDYISQT